MGKSVKGMLDIEIWVNCPHCDFYINILDESDTNGHIHNEEGHILNQACPDGSWHEKHKSFEVEDVTCSDCKNNFKVTGLEW